MATMRSLGFSIFTRYDGSGVREARRDMDSFNGSVNRSTSAMNSWSGRIILATKAIMVFGPALVPIAAHMAAIGGAAAAMGASVGGALTVYGAAMKGAITSTMDAKEKISGLREELNKQKATLATLKPGTEAYNKQLKEVAATQKELDAALKALSPSQRSFIQATDQMSSAWKKFIDATKDKTLATATNVVRGLTAGIGLLKPILDAVHPIILKVSKDFENWMKGDSAKNYANLIKASAVPALKNLVAAGKDVINVLGDGFRAFLPQGKALSETIRDGARALREWSDGGGFQRFLAYVREVAPQVREFWQTLWAALKNVLSAMRELGPFALGLVTIILKLVAALPPEWIEAIVKGFVAWKVAMAAFTVAQLIAGIATLVPLVWAFTAALLANPITWVVAAIIALGVALYMLVKHWDTVSAALGTAWNATWNALKTAAEAVWNALKTAWEAVVNALKTAWDTVSGAIKTAWDTVWNALKTAAETVWNWLKTAWEAVVNALKTAWDTVSGALKTAWDATWNALKTAAETVWNFLKTAWETFINGLQTIWTTVSGALNTAWEAVWNALKTAAEAVWNFLKTAWETFINGLQTIWTTVSGALKTAWEAVWNALKTAAETVWNWLKTAWEAVVNALKTAWDTVSGALKTAWDTVWNGIKTAAETVWNALKTAWDTVLNALKTAWDTVSSALKTAWDTVWNGIKTAADTVWNLIKTAWDTFLNAVKTAWDTFSSALKTAWDTVWNAIKTAAEAVWNLVKTAWDTFLNAVKTAWDKFSEAIKDAWNTVWNWIKDKGKEIWDAIKGFWEDYLNGVKVLWDDFSEKIKSAWEAVWNWLKDTAQKIWHGIGEVIEKAVNGIIGVINGITGAWDKIAGAVGLDGLKIGKIDPVSLNFAAGGIVGDMPTFANGGVLPGYAPGRDTVPAMLSRGEGILVPEAVKGLGANFVHAANYHFSHGRGGRNVAFPGYAEGGITGPTKRGCELPGYARGGIAAFGRDPANRDGWGTSFFQGGGVVMAPPDPADENYTVGPGGVIIGGSSSTSPDAADTGQDDPSKSILDRLGVGVAADGLGNIAETGMMVLGFIGKAAIEALFESFMATLNAFGEAGDFGKIIAGGTKKLLLQMIEKLVSEDEKAKEKFTSMSVAGAQSVQAWAPLAAKALQMAGLDQSQLQAFLALMAAESGGNPNAINLWDINAQNGVPSQGLMQVIPTTFAANHVAGTSNNILDPLANMAAAARYILNRYGGIVPGSPYAEGTANATPGLHLVGEEGPELVTGPGYANFGGGETVTPAAETAAILSGANVPAVTPPTPEGGGLPEDTAIDSPLTQQMQQVSAAPQVDGWFGEVIGAAQHMLATVQAAWTNTVAAGSSAEPAIASTTTAVGNEIGVAIPSNLEAMSAAAAAAWADMSATSLAAWQAQLAGVYTPAETHMGTTMPEKSLAMQVAHDLAWTTMNATSAAQWTVMRDTTYLEAETHQGTTMPAASLAMQTAHDLAWTTMNTTSAAQWTIMRDTTYLEAETHQGTTMPAASVAMQTAHDLAWTTMNTTSTTAWTAIRDNNILPFEEHMQTTMPAAATAMNEAVSTAFTTMVETIVTQLDTAIAKIEEFIAATEAAIAAAQALAQAQAAAAAAGAAGGAGGTPGAGVNGGSDLNAALAAAGNPPIIQGPYSDGALSAGTHTGGGVVDVPVSYFDAMIAAGFIGWIRSGPGWEGNEHAHMILPGTPDLSPQAQAQVADYYAGGDGLGLARGTNNAAAGWTWVGEEGPELMRMRGGEQVMPHQASMEYARAMRRRRGWMSRQKGSWGGGGGRSYDRPRRDFTASIEANSEAAGSYRASRSGDGINIEFNFNGPVNNGDDVRRAMDEAIPKLRTALQAGSGRRRIQ